MAQRVTSNIPAWEKSGNITWVQCPKCTGWLPVDPELAVSDSVEMVCPHCATQFAGNKAPRIV